jgi:PST family polysaccharide transporter
LAVFLVLARLLTPEAFGLVAMAAVFVALMEVFLDQGFAEAIIQRGELDRAHLDTAFWTNLAGGVLLTGLGVSCSGLVAAFFGEPELASVVRWLSLTFLFGSFRAVQFALLRRQLAFGRLAAVTVSAIIVGGVVGVGMALAGFGVWSLVGQQLSTRCVEALGMWLASSWRPRLNFSPQHAQELLLFGVNVLGLNTLTFVNVRVDDLLIGYFLGPVALGYYSVGYRLIRMLVQLVAGTVYTVAFPTFSKIRQQPERLRRAFFTTCQMAAVVAFPAFLGIAALAPEFVRAVFGGQWAPSSPVMRVLALVGMLEAILYFNSALLLAVGKPSWDLAVRTANTVANILAFMVAVRWGIVAVAAAYVVRGYLLSPASVATVRRAMDFAVTSYARLFAAPIVAASGMLAGVIAMKWLLGGYLGPNLALAVYVGTGIMLYGILLVLLAPGLAVRVVTAGRTALTVRKTQKRASIE